jgi:phosphatidylinositol alpha-1,6-mannosyltransferase
MNTGTEGAPRALLVTRNFPPLVGGMERLNHRLLAALAAAGPVALVGPVGCRAHAASAERVVEVRLRPLWRFLAGAAVAAARLARALRPVVVVAGSGLVAPQALCAARLVGARCAVYVHGLDLVATNPIYQRCWLPAIRRADHVLANSRHTARLAVARGIAPERISIVTPGVDGGAAVCPDAAALRALHGLGEGPVLLSVGRLTARKGLEAFVRDVLPIVAARHPGVRLAIIGEEPRDALHAAGGAERARVLAAADAAGMAERVVLLGRVDDARLAELLAVADLHVFPVQAIPGDVEGFGMVALEAAAQGTPTLGYAVGGVPDAVEQGASGELVEAGDARALAEAILRWLARPRGAAAVACRAFAGRNDWDAFGRKLREALA